MVDSLVLDCESDYLGSILDPFFSKPPILSAVHYCRSLCVCLDSGFRAEGLGLRGFGLSGLGGAV